MADRNEGWQPIATAPKDGRYLLCAIAGYELPVAARWHVKRDGWYVGERWSRNRSYTPTHWRPLPIPPPAPLSEHGAPKEG